MLLVVLPPVEASSFCRQVYRRFWTAVLVRCAGAGQVTGIPCFSFYVTSGVFVSLKLVDVLQIANPRGFVMKSLFSLFLMIVALSTVAPAKELLNVDRNGVAIQGYDPVSFFTDNRPVKGNEQFQSEYRGAKYYFVSSEHKAAFDKEPAKYEPQFGGYCAYGVSHGSRAPVKIEAWQIVNGRLLMQYDLGVKDEFNKDQQGTLKKADQNWPGLVDKYGK